MAYNDFHFTTRWLVEGAYDDVCAVVSNIPDLQRWFSSVCLASEMQERGDLGGCGMVVALALRGWFPYTLHCQMRVTELRSHGFTVAVAGDLPGHCSITFKSYAAWIEVTYDWHFSVARRLLRHVSLPLRLLVTHNYHWAMNLGEDCLKKELLYRSVLV